MPAVTRHGGCAASQQNVSGSMSCRQHLGHVDKAEVQCLGVSCQSYVSRNTAYMWCPATGAPHLPKRLEAPGESSQQRHLHHGIDGLGGVPAQLCHDDPTAAPPTAPQAQSCSCFVCSKQPSLARDRNQSWLMTHNW